MSAHSGPLFAAYTRLPERVPPWIGTALRGLGLAGALGVVLAAIAAPPVGLTLFWGLFVPVVPLLFLIALGLWGNVCPMAALNQLPRALGFTRGWALPSRVQQSAPLISGGLFLLILPLRKITLDHDGAALAVFLLALLGLALVGGLTWWRRIGRPQGARACPSSPITREHLPCLWVCKILRRMGNTVLPPEIAVDLTPTFTIVLPAPAAPVSAMVALRSRAMRRRAPDRQWRRCLTCNDS